MSPGSDERAPGDAGLDEAPVDKFLRLTAASDGFLRSKRGEVVGAYVTLNVGGITAAERDEPEPGDD